MYMIGWTGDYGDPDNFYSAFYGPGGSDDINWNPPELNALLEKGRAAVTQAEKAKIYAQIHEMTYKANYRIPIVHSQPLGGARTYVKGWIANPLGTGALNGVSVPARSNSWRGSTICSHSGLPGLGLGRPPSTQSVCL